MNASIVPRLIAKDLFLMRPIMIGALVLGGIGVALMPVGETPFIGWIVLFIAVTLLGIFATVVGVVTERNDRVHLLMLTLPISPGQYLRAKLTANAIAFFGPWGILLATALALVAVTSIPNGIIPFLIMLLCYVVCYYAAYLGMSLVTPSAILSTVVIILGNTAPVFLIPVFLRVSGISVDAIPADAAWTGPVLGVVVGEFAFSAAVLSIALWLRSRQRDHI